VAYARPFLSAATPRPPVRITWIPPGDLGIIATLLAMRATARAALAYPITMTTARQIGGATPTTRAQFLRSWLAQHTQFQPDPDDVELVRTPVEQLARIAKDGVAKGDCDDVATLGAALALALGLKPRFIVLDFGDGYQHVYTDVLGGAVDFDVTRRANPPTPTRASAMEV
jgi:transglutaminase-like putative cysteine protease